MTQKYWREIIFDLGLVDLKGISWSTFEIEVVFRVELVQDKNKEITI